MTQNIQALGREFAGEAATAIDSFPALKNWKPAPGFSALGLFCGLLFWNLFYIAGALLVCLLLGVSNAAYEAGVSLFVLFRALAILFYALKYYVSYYGERPKIKSSRAISFLNYFFGTAIFGWCWNANLKRSHIIERPEKGSSYIVATVIYGIIALIYVVLTCMWISSATYGIDEVSKAYILEDASSPDIELGNNNRYFDSAVGASFVLPNSWHKGALKEDRRFLRFKAEPDDGTPVLILYGAYSTGGSTDEEQVLEDFEGSISGTLSDCEDELIERVTISDNEFWEITGSGVNVYRGVDLPVSVTMLIHIENEIVYVFEYYDYAQDADTSLYKIGFDALVASAVFE